MLRAGVVGVGYLGQFHAQKYSKLNDVTLVAVADVDESRAKGIADQLGIQATHDYRTLIGQVDCVSIVVPTQSHFEVAEFFLSRGVHVLVEKPITVSVDQATILIDLAKKNNVKLQVGHLERFNATVMALAGHLDDPRFIESTRIAPFNLRGSDVNVMLDLMIHDIDIILSIVKSPIQKIDANGARVVSSMADIANARITFENGCVANVTASRVSIKSERKMRLFQRDGYFSLDLQNRKLSIFQKGEGEMFPGIPSIKHDTKEFPEDDALMTEIHSFIESILKNKTPVVSGEAGKRSLETAIAITEMIQSKEDF